MPLNLRSKWEHCLMVKNRVSFLGADRLFENKKDGYASERAAWDELEKEGWELVAVTTNKNGEPMHYFKRRVEE